MRPSAPTETPLPMQQQVETPPKCRVALPFELHDRSIVALTGTLTQETPNLFYLDVDRGGHPLTPSTAWEAVRMAICDGRITLPDPMRAAIEKGAKIL